jgi:signal transduction histidine kinase
MMLALVSFLHALEAQKSSAERVAALLDAVNEALAERGGPEFDDLDLELDRAPRGGLSALGRLPQLFLAVAAGTAFLLLVVYGLLMRLVLRPVEDLVAASRSLSDGSRPLKVTGESRADEMGELVRAFNRMAAEVSASREELERRVDEAVRERERAKERLVLEQRLSATGKLAAGVAHEISNPLGGMINAARSVAKEPGLSDRARGYVRLIDDGLGRIMSIVERMRTLVRAEHPVGPVDLAAALEGALSFARHRIDEERVELERDVPGSPVRVTGSAGELQQVFLNLIVNALDSMREAERRRLSVRLAVEGDRALVEVSDTGCGMTDEQLASAFDLFYSTKGEEGTGLGLAITHRIVADHGGELDLESSPGRGTTARARFPLEGPGG